MARKLAKRESLNTKVVSIGALTMGGAGKSPAVVHLAELLDQAHRNPAILTRGYARGSPGDIVIVAKGEAATIKETGDEAQTFVHAAHAHVGIGANRYAAGKRMEETLTPGIFLLDDGFQHAQLKRDQDLVLMDARDPLAGGVFPLGRRREPLEALSRATAIIITRADPGWCFTGLERLIRCYNPSARIFVSRVVPKQWVPLPPAGLVGAFCALGDPTSFWRTLDSLGIQVAFRRAFSDHHPYRPSELRRLAAQASAAGAEALVTTEKDIMNLPEGAGALLEPHKLLWLRIGVEVDNEQELLRLIL
jgi:tetraacyldisaccharide 4'-kinase